MEYYLLHSEDYLAHFGIRGMKWGRRHWQYQDGDYTPDGKLRYGIGDGESHHRLDSKKATKSASIAKSFKSQSASLAKKLSKKI